MKTSIQILPGVRRIGYVDSRFLPKGVPLHGICNNPVPVLTAINWIPFFGDPDCRCHSEKEGGWYQDTATLKFSTSRYLPVGRTLGFIVEDVNGNTYIIGQQEPPFPKVICDKVLGTPSGDTACLLYDITHVSIKSLVPCII